MTTTKISPEAVEYETCAALEPRKPSCQDPRGHARPSTRELCVQRHMMALARASSSLRCNHSMKRVEGRLGRVSFTALKPSFTPMGMARRESHFRNCEGAVRSHSISQSEPPLLPVRSLLGILQGRTERTGDIRRLRGAVAGTAGCDMPSAASRLTHTLCVAASARCIQECCLVYCSEQRVYHSC